MGLTPNTKRCLQTRSVWRCWSYLKRSLQPSGLRSCCTTCSRCPSRRSPPSWGALRSRHGDFEALLAVLDPDVVLRADAGAVRAGLSREVRGAAAVAEQALFFSRAAPSARPALVNGAAAVVASGGRPIAVMGFTVRHGKIVEIDILADPTRLRQLDLAVLDD